MEKDTRTIEELQEEYGLQNYDTSMIQAFIACFGADDLSSFEESYSGQFDSDEDFARDMAENIGETIATHWPHYCIDWEYAARELMYDYCESDGYYFRNF